MNLDENNIEREEIIYRYFQEELSTEEMEQVEEWSNLSKENKQEFDRIHTLFLDLKGLTYYKEVASQVENSWENFQEENNIPQLLAKVNRPLIFMKYAASALILASAAFALYFLQNRPEEIAVSDINQVQDLLLADGSHVTLNEGATLSYLEPFQNERRVTLSGSGYFEVVKMRDHPFMVEIDEVQVRVLGTKFFIHKQSSGNVGIQVDEGKVLVSYREIDEIVTANRHINIDLKNEEIAEVDDVTGLTAFWKKKKLVFTMTSIEEVVTTINQAYKTSIQLEGNTHGCALSVVFDDESLETVLDVIAGTLGYEVVQNQNSYVLKSNGCQ